MEFTGRNVAKFVAKSIVHSTVKQKTEDVITDYTRFEEDDIIVPISGHIVGWYISDKLKPLTDSMVDKTADFIANKRAKRAAKKTPEEN